MPKVPEKAPEHPRRGRGRLLDDRSWQRSASADGGRRCGRSRTPKVDSDDDEWEGTDDEQAKFEAAKKRWDDGRFRRAGRTSQKLGAFFRLKAPKRPAEVPVDADAADALEVDSEG